MYKKRLDFDFNLVLTKTKDLLKEITPYKFRVLELELISLVAPLELVSKNFHLIFSYSFSILTILLGRYFSNCKNIKNEGIMVSCFHTESMDVWLTCN